MKIDWCERCGAYGCPSAVACGDCYLVRIGNLRSRVRELEEAILKHKDVCFGNWEQTFGKLMEKEVGDGS